MKPLLALSIIALAFGAMLTGCGSSNDSAPATAAATPATPPNASTSSATHMSPEAQAAKAAADGK